MFEDNILTFNPGWDQNGKEAETLTDVRGLPREIKNQGINPINEVDEATNGPASMMLVDPDGNYILIDQHR